MMKRNRARRDRKLTFAEHLEVVRPRANRNLFGKASIANAVAKITWGRHRELAYKVKHRSLRRLIDRGHVLVCADQDRCLGLLSVRLDFNSWLRTHERWLEASE